MKWKTDNPPKDGRPFIGVYGYHMPTLMVYDSWAKDFSVAVVSTDATADDTEAWFDTEDCKESEITAWMRLPEAPE